MRGEVNNSEEVIMSRKPTVSRGVQAWLVGLAVLILAGCSNVVRLPDCIDCRPVEMGVDQTLEIDLGPDRTISNDPDAYAWVLADTGTMRLVDEQVIERPEDPTEWVGGYSMATIFRLEPTTAGTTEVVLQCVPTDDPANPVDTMEIVVEVSA
jgi:hypothetical protein